MEEKLPVIEDLIGKNVILITVTFFYTGKLVNLTATDFVLQQAAWIANTGRWAQALTVGVRALEEVEPYPDDLTVFVSRGAYVKASEWPHPLPRETK